MLLLMTLTMSAFSHDSEKEETIPTNDSFDYDDDNCALDWCNHFNEIAENDCKMYRDDMDLRADTECDPYIWLDGDCFTGADGCRYLEEEGRCLNRCWVVGADPWWWQPQWIGLRWVAGTFF